jgi:polar amino acid transport system substrate-binding protein
MSGRRTRTGSSTIALAAVLVAVGTPMGTAGAQERIVLVTPPNTVDTVISEVITRRAYGRLGIAVEIRKYPGERALRLANSGRVDGEVQRIDGITATYRNLVQVRPAINFIEGAVFSHGKTFMVAGWQSLRPYRIGYIRGIKFAEQNTRDMDSHGTGDYTRLFQMLRTKRFDIIVSPRLNGLYQMLKLGVEDVVELKPAIMRFDLFHYLNKKHAALAPKIGAVFTEMKKGGELASIRAHVISVLMERAARKLPVCDDDYACFD